MSPENQNSMIETKQLVALAAVLFLAPAIKPTLEANDITFSEEDKPFIESYLQYGNYMLYTLGGSLFILLLGKYVFENKIFIDMSQVIAAVVIIMVLIGIFAIFRKKQIIVDKKITRNNIISLVWKK